MRVKRHCLVLPDGGLLDLDADLPHTSKKLKQQCAVGSGASLDQNEIESAQLDGLAKVFFDQLEACLEECARGRLGLFSDLQFMSDQQPEQDWPEATRLRELALALQNIFAQQEQRNPLCDEFLDLCSMHGESHPGEPRLARQFLARIGRGQVGSPTQEPSKPW